MKVDYNQLGLAQQVLDRQASQHLTKMEQYISDNCVLSAVDLGLILAALSPINQAIVLLGCKVVNVTEQVFELASERMTKTIDTYVEADQEVYETLNSLMKRLGASLPPFTDPRTSIPELGAAETTAPDGWGDAEPDMFTQAREEDRQIRQIAKDALAVAQDRVERWASGKEAVVEEKDASSYLVPPQASSSEIENMRWSAGVLLGGVDWLFEQLAGFSFIEDVIMKPFAGNWDEIEKVSLAWENVDYSLVAVGSNASGLTSSLSTWEGKGSEAFLAATGLIASAVTGLSYAAGYVSQLINKVLLVSKAVALVIGRILKHLFKKLICMAAKAAVPVVGWAAAAAETALLVADIIGYVRTAYSLINMLYDAIYDVIDAKVKLLDVCLSAENLLSGLVNAGLTRAT